MIMRNLLIAALASCAMAQPSFNEPHPLLLASNDSLKIPALPLPVRNTDENPYFKGTGQRIAGYILLVQGAIGLARGIYGDVHNSTRGTVDWIAPNYSGQVPVWITEAFDKVTWVEGGLRTACSIPLLIAGYRQLARWNKWEKEERELTPAGAYPMHIELVFQF